MQAADEAAPDRVAAGHEDDWYSRGRRFGRKRRWIAADCNDDGHLPLHEISDQRGQSIVLAIGPTIIDYDVSIIDESSFTEALLEQRDQWRVRDWRTGAEQTEDKTLRLWDAATGQQIGPAMKHDVWVLGAVLTKDERRILSWSDDKTLRLWDAATGQQIGRNGWATVVVVICFNRARPRPSLFL